MRDNQTVAEVLTEGLARITPQTWFQGTTVAPGRTSGFTNGETGSQCALLALRGRAGPACAVLVAANDLEPAANDAQAVVRWNNDSTTSYEDVVLGFKRAIEYAQERGL